MSFANQNVGQWIPSDQIPTELSHHFGMNSDPLKRVQHQDMERTEAQRREDSGRGDSIADKTRSTLEMQPPPQIRDPVLRDTYNAGWTQGFMAAAREAAMAQAAAKQPRPEHQPEHSYQPTLQPRR